MKQKTTIAEYLLNFCRFVACASICSALMMFEEKAVRIMVAIRRVKEMQTAFKFVWSVFKLEMQFAEVNISST